MSNMITDDQPRFYVEVSRDPYPTCTRDATKYGTEPFPPPEVLVSRMLT